MAINRVGGDRPYISRSTGTTANLTPVAGTLSVPATSDAATAALVNTASATSAALTALYARPTGTTVALLGASITQETSLGAGVYDTPTASPATYAFGAFAWANVLLGQRLTLVKNAGVGGNTSTQIAARLTDVTSLTVRPQWCIVADWATNDVLTDVATATVLANGEAIVAGLLAAGVKVVLCTILPTSGFTTSGRKTTISKVNAWVQAQSSRSGVVVCDAAPYMVDVATGLDKTGVLRDGTHMTNLGGELTGIALADALRPYVGGSTALVTSAVDTTTLTLNPQMTGTAGTKGAGMTGTVADSWNAAWSGAAGTAVLSKVTRTDNIGGDWQQIQMTGAGQMWFQQLLFAGFAAGDVIQFECEWQADNNWTAVKRFNAYLDASGVRSSNDLYATEVSPQNYVWPGASGVLRTPPLTVAAAPTYLAGQLVIEGSAGTVRIGRARIKKIN